MPYFTSGRYVYFKDIEEVPKIYYKYFMMNQES